MATANWMVAWTISTLATLGRMCRRVMPSGPRPIAVAARTKSRLQNAKAAPRVTRANTGTLKIAMARMALRALAPSTEVIRMATVSYTHLRAHETPEHLVCRLL